MSLRRRVSMRFTGVNAVTTNRTSTPQDLSSAGDRQCSDPASTFRFPGLRAPPRAITARESREEQTHKKLSLSLSWVRRLRAPRHLKVVPKVTHDVSPVGLGRAVNFRDKKKGRLCTGPASTRPKTRGRETFRARVAMNTTPTGSPPAKRDAIVARRFHEGKSSQ
jgi:hypothetical protein